MADQLGVRTEDAGFEEAKPGPESEPLHMRWLGKADLSSPDDWAAAGFSDSGIG
jgi:hypothetical protein